MIVSTQTQVPVPAGSHCRNADIGQIKETCDGRVHGTGPCSWPTTTSCVRSAPFPRVNPLAPPASMVGSGSTGRPTAGLAFRGTEARAPSTRSHFILPRRHPRCAQASDSSSLSDPGLGLARSLAQDVVVGKWMVFHPHSPMTKWDSPIP
jgi:hypothetical protein